MDGFGNEVVLTFSTIEPSAVVSASPLEVKGDLISFQLKESNQVDVTYDTYEISLKQIIEMLHL